MRHRLTTAVLTALLLTGSASVFPVHALETSVHTQLPSAKEGWDNSDGNWHYYENEEAKTGWITVSGQKYYMNEDGVMMTGWLKDEDNWYYLRSSGEMATGWLKDGNAWYYLNEEGMMVTGWLNLGNTWYYMTDSGAMATGWAKVEDSWYYLNRDGAMWKGWLKLNNTWYYLKNSGAMATGWVKSGNLWYYMNEDGAMTTGWVFDGTHWYYLNRDGVMLTGWQKIDNTWYYLNGSGVMATGWVASGSSWYYMNGSGEMVTGWKEVQGDWYYMNSDGVMQSSDWMASGNKWYYLSASGKMLKNTEAEIDGSTYLFRANGAMASNELGIFDTDGNLVYAQPLTAPYERRDFTQEFASNRVRYYVSSGARVSGWAKLDSYVDKAEGESDIVKKWFYFGSDGNMVYNTKVDGWYLGTDGAGHQNPYMSQEDFNKKCVDFDGDSLESIRNVFGEDYTYVLIPNENIQGLAKYDAVNGILYVNVVD